MAGKYGKARHRESKRQSSFAQNELPDDARDPYFPPSRNELDSNEWTENQDEFRIFYYCWYDPAKNRLVDFVINLHLDRGPQFPEGPLIASADCTNHGSCHMHDETSSTRREQRHEILKLYCREDVETALGIVVEKLVPFGRMIVKAGRGQK